MSKDTRRAVAGIAIALTACVALGTVFLGYPALYADRIYPGVSVQDIHLAGLSVDQATALLANRLSPPSGRALDLTGIERSWHLDWDDVGRRYDPARTADEAYEAGRSGIWLEQVLAAWRIRLHGASIQPRVEPADPAQVRALLDSIAAQIHVPPTEAAVHIGTNRVTCVPGEAGRVLDVEATTSHVIAALADGTPEVELVTVARQPEVREAEPGCTRARTLLSRPFTLIADDPLTDYRSAFEAPPERMASWLRARPASDHVMLDVKEAAVEAWLLEIAPQLGSERILDLEETLRRTMAALEDGELQARTAIRHPQHTYVVQPGDTLFDIAYNHGFPQWRLEEANPEVGPDELLIGMELTIPSIDVLFPEPLVPGRRIQIDLPEQHVRAYEEGALVYDFTCSSGMTSTPTIAGQFQVLFKEPEAYAQRWSLEMPYFMAIYYEGPDFANGIHELPIRSNGQRLWASVLGWPASYGCIILDVGDAKALYDWAPVGTLVQIEGVAPGTPVYVPTYDDQGPEG